MSARVYLDYNATAPLRPEAKEAMHAAMELIGNPSSVHAEGRKAKALIEKARQQVAQAIGAKRDEIIFTSGATEAAEVLNSFTNKGIRVDAKSHDALFSKQGSVDGDGIYALGLANSETGEILDVPDHGADKLCLDITQVIGRIPFAFEWSGADFAIFSGHKFGAPKGVGVLVVKEGLDIKALSTGGGQEMGRRAGTENVIGIAAMGAAIEAATKDLDQGVWDPIAKMRDALEEALIQAEPDLVIIAKDKKRLLNTSCFAMPGWKGETQVIQMDLAGFAISAGSACSSGKVKSSRVLQAMGFDEQIASSAIRVSLGPKTQMSDVTSFVDAWTKALKKFKARAA